MKLLNMNEINSVAGGLEAQLMVEFAYSTPYSSTPSVYYYNILTGPADVMLAKIASHDYPSHLEGFPACTLSGIYIESYSVLSN